VGTKNRRSDSRSANSDSFRSDPQLWRRGSICLAGGIGLGLASTVLAPRPVAGSGARPSPLLAHRGAAKALRTHPPASGSRSAALLVMNMYLELSTVAAVYHFGGNCFEDSDIWSNFIERSITASRVCLDVVKNT
jgi:hypothetical protein